MDFSIKAFFGGDTTNLRQAAEEASRIIHDSSAESESAVGKFAEKFAHHFTNFRMLSGALATALGLHFHEIADNIARVFTGISKESEEALKGMAKVTTETADLLEKTLEKHRTDEQNVALLQEKQNGLYKQRDELLAEIEARGKRYMEIERSGTEELGTLLILQRQVGKSDEENLRLAEIAHQLQVNDSKLQQDKADIKKKAGEADKQVAAEYEKLEKEALATTARITAEKEKQDDLAESIRAHTAAMVDKARVEHLPAEARITELTKERNELSSHLNDWGLNIVDKAKMEQEIAGKTLEIGKIQLTIEQQRAIELKKIATVAEEINSQYDQARRQSFAQNALGITEFENVPVQKPRTQTEFANAADDILVEIIRRDQARIKALEDEKYTVASSGAEAVTGFFLRSLVQGFYGQDAANAQAVLSQRQTARGQTRAEIISGYGGDPLNVDTFISQTKNTNDIALQSNQQLKTITSLLTTALTPKG